MLAGHLAIGHQDIQQYDGADFDNPFAQTFT
jgi:hypothetical protein